MFSGLSIIDGHVRNIAAMAAHRVRPKSMTMTTFSADEATDATCMFEPEAFAVVATVRKSFLESSTDVVRHCVSLGSQNAFCRRGIEMLPSLSRAQLECALDVRKSSGDDDDFCCLTHNDGGQISRTFTAAIEPAFWSHGAIDWNTR
jgi:hypothetical protein